MRMFIISKNKYLSNDMKICGTFSIPFTQKYLFFYSVGLYRDVLIMHLSILSGGWGYSDSIPADF